MLDLVPVLSWVLDARAGAATAARAIAWRYPLTELLCAAWAVLLYLQVGLGPALPLLALWGFLLIALLWIDLDFQLLPDVAHASRHADRAGRGALPSRAARGTRCSGIVIGSGLLWLLAWGYLQVRKIEGMGGGDIKLAAMFGVVLGWQLTLLTLFLAALAGSIWGVLLIARRGGGGQTALPFGTLLAPAAMVAFLWGPALITGYSRLLHP